MRTGHAGGKKSVGKTAKTSEDDEDDEDEGGESEGRRAGPETTQGISRPCAG